MWPALQSHPSEFGENHCLRMLREYPVSLTHQQLPTEELERCWVDGQKHGQEERGEEGPGLTSHTPSTKAKLKEGGRRDSIEEGTVACSGVARAFD